MTRSQSLSARLRIWHIAELYPPDYGGGAAIYVQDVCQFLADRGHEVRVLCTENVSGAAPYAIRTEKDRAVHVDRMNLPYFRSRDPAGWALSVRLWRQHAQRVSAVVSGIVESWTPDIVNFHTPHSLYEECLPVIHRYGIPVVGMAHCAWLICPRLDLMRSPTNEQCEGPGVLRCLECLYSHWDGSHMLAAAKLPWRILKLGIYPAYRLLGRRRSATKVGALICPSSYLAKVHGGRMHGPAVHVPLGIDLTHLPITRPQRPRSPLRFGFVGGFQPHKGIDDVLLAGAALKKRGFSFELHIWGPERPGATEMIARSGLEGEVRFKGMYEAQERWAVFADIDVLIMATRRPEPFGRVVQEAAAAGVPTIAPATGGIVEQILNGTNGLLYSFRNVGDLEARMATMLDEPDLVRRFASNLWNVRHTGDAVRDVEAVYRSVLDKSRAQSRDHRGAGLS